MEQIPPFDGDHPPSEDERFNIHTFFDSIMHGQTYPSQKDDQEQQEFDGIQEGLEEDVTAAETLLTRSHHVDMEQLEVLHGRELAEMSVQERDRNYEEIHGVDEIAEERPEFVAKSFHEMDVALQNIRSKPAYDQAEQMDRTYAQDRKFRLSFLRAERFDGTKAARRMVKYFEEKLFYFGPAVLCRKLCQADLDDDDMECLRRGTFQQLPCRDHTGRAVILCGTSKETIKYKNPINFLRAAIYIFLAIAEDEETQRRGVVFVTYVLGDLAEVVDHNTSNTLPHIMDWVPFRLAAQHILINDPMMKRLFPLVLLSMGYERRKKARIFHGTVTEYHYHLMTFGIPIDHLPITYDGGLKTKEFDRFLARQHAKEGNQYSRPNSLLEVEDLVLVELPGLNDVLLGKGKPIQNHSGNIRMRYWIDLHMEEYQQALIGDKKLVAIKVANKLRNHLQYPSRFLKRIRKDGCWTSASDEEAISKIFRTFRSIPPSKAREIIQKHSNDTAIQLKNNKSSDLREMKRVRRSEDNSGGYFGGSSGRKKTSGCICDTQELNSAEFWTSMQ